MNDKKEQIKIALLAIIAGTLIIQTVIGPGGNSGSSDNPADTEPIPGAVQPTMPQSLNATPGSQIAQEAIKIEKPVGPLTSMKFTEDLFDFGNIKQNSTNKHIFKFTNTGTNPLIISNAAGSCGCTVPQWPKEPVPPGAVGEIVVEYKPGTQKDNQQKTVTVTANTDPVDTRISIKAMVEEVIEKK